MVLKATLRPSAIKAIICCHSNAHKMSYLTLREKSRRSNVVYKLIGSLVVAYMCGIMWSMGKVQWAKQLIWVNKWVVSGSFSLCFIKTCQDASLNMSHLKCVMPSYIITKIHNVMSSYDIVMSLVTSLTVHMWQVTWPFGIKLGCMQYGSVISPKTFEQLGHLKHTQVAMCLVHPCGWSLLPSTVLHKLTCVFAKHVQFITCT